MIYCRNFDISKDNPFVFYNKEKYFEQIENKLLKQYGIPRAIIKDTIIRELGNSDKQKIGFVKYFLFFIILILSVFFYKKKDKKAGDIIFDNFTINAYDRFYKYLFNKFSNKSFAYISKEKSNSYPEQVKFIRIRKLYNKKISLKIIKNEIFNYFKYKKYSAQYGIDLVTLHIKILHWIARYTSDMDNITYKILISSGDNYYNALRYYIYKKSICNIFLFQNGTRGAGFHNISKDYCTYCDIYFAYGTQSILLQQGMFAKKKISFGSISLLPYIDDKSYNRKPKYDIVFLEQMTPFYDSDFENKVLKNATFENYMLMIDNLVKFSNEFSNLKILYRVTTVKRESYPKIVDEIEKKLKNSNIIVDFNIHNNSLDAIINSNISVLYSSSIGFEAIGLGKKVLFLNYNNLDFVLSSVDEIGVLTNKSYNSFKDKLLGLIDDESIDTNKYFLKNKKLFMNISKYSNRFLNTIIYKSL